MVQRERQPKSGRRGPEPEPDRVSAREGEGSLALASQLGNRGVVEVLRSAQRAHGARGRDGLDDAVVTAIQRRRGRGGPLPASVRGEAEPALGADLTRVRVHTDDRADELARGLQAKAFTVGGDIFFRKGAYAPSNRTGQQLLAHELAHTVQQGDSRGKPDRVSSPDDAAERQADEIARSFHAAPQRSGGLNADPTTGSPSERSPGRRHCGMATAAELPATVTPLQVQRVDVEDFVEGLTGEEVGLFPIFVGPETSAAYDDVKRQIGKDPRDPGTTAADLGKVETPPGQEEAYRRVLTQLYTEVSLRESARRFFRGLNLLVLQLYGSYQNRLESVTGLVELEDSDVVKIFITKVVEESLSGLGAIPKVGKVVEATVKVLWATAQEASKAAGANTYALTVVNAVDRLDEDFNHAIDRVEEVKADVLSDWGKLQLFADVEWPPTTAEFRREAGRSYELRLWKELLPLKWKVFKGESTFHRDISWVDRWRERNPTHLMKLERGTSGWWIFERSGWWATEYWLGSGTHPFSHTQPEAGLVERITTELGVDKEELMLDWGLPTARLIQTQRGWVGP